MPSERPAAAPPAASPDFPGRFAGDAERAFASLEQLRGLLALYVVIAHARAILWIGLHTAKETGAMATYNAVEKLLAYANLFTRFGNEAVIVFFVLSGFSIAHALRFHPPAARFFFRRFLRLYPVKLAAIGWALAIFFLAIRLAPELLQMTVPYGLSMSFVTPLVILKNVSYMPEGELVRPLWSLPYEMLFYLLAPLLTLRPKTFLAVAATTWTLGATIDFASWPPTNQPGIVSFLLHFVFHYAVLFALGVMTYLFYEPLLAAMKRSRGLFLAAASVLTLVTLGLQLRFDFRFGNQRDLLTGLVGVGLVLVVSQLHVQSRWLDRLGRQSYSLYVSHMPTIIALSVTLKAAGLTQLAEPRPWVWMVAPFASVLVAELLFHAVERPVRTYLERTRVQLSARGSRGDALRSSPPSRPPPGRPSSSRAEHDHHEPARLHRQRHPHPHRHLPR